MSTTIHTYWLILVSIIKTWSSDCVLFMYIHTYRYLLIPSSILYCSQTPAAAADHFLLLHNSENGLLSWLKNCWSLASRINFWQVFDFARKLVCVNYLWQLLRNKQEAGSILVYTRYTYIQSAWKNSILLILPIRFWLKKLRKCARMSIILTAF